MSKARDLANAGTALTTVSATELGYLDGVTSAVQTQINSKITGSSAIAPTIVDAKGDIIAASAADTVARLAVGTNGQVLTAASGEATGLQWATPASPSLTLSEITSGSINSGTSLNITGLTQDFIQLQIVGVTFATADAAMQCLINGSTSTVYSYSSSRMLASGTIGRFDASANNYLPLNSQGSVRGVNASNHYVLTLQNCKSTGFTTYSWTAGFVDDASNNSFATGSGVFKTAAQVTSLTIKNSASYAFNGTGTYAVYGG